MKRDYTLLWASLAAVVMTIFMTWPQAIHMRTQLASHQDPEFSIWRLAWIAHALASAPRQLFNGNIFYPSPRTLTYSDATLLEGVLAAPLFWLKLSPILIYNIVLLAGIAGSGIGAFVLARELTGRTLPAMYATAVFTMAPYRVEHFMHLELQWAMWIPLTLWALHVAVARSGSLKYGLLAGLFLWLQIISCVYYGVFLAIAVAAFVIVCAVVEAPRFVRALPSLAAGGLLALALTAPYLWFYVQTARSMGPRDQGEIGLYSGSLFSYFVSPPQNLLWGWTSSPPERNLLLGISVIAVAFAGALFYRARRQRIAFATIAIVAITLSFGLNTPVYRVLIDIAPGLRGLRSPSRFAIVTCCAVGVLGAFGIHAAQQWAASARMRWAKYLPAALFALLILEYTNTGMLLMDLSGQPAQGASVYKIMRSAGPGVVVELPMPTAGTLPGNDTEYEMWSLTHWHPLVNGYSGYYPSDYLETLARMETFPDDESLARLRRLDVRYVIVHCKFYVKGKDHDLCPALLARIGERAELRSYGKYTDPTGAPAYLFELKR
jgi:hypothetical protein